MKSILIALVVFLTASLSAFAGPTIVFMVGEREYETLDSLTNYYETELKPNGFRGIFISAPHEGETKDDFPGLAEALEEADLVFVSVRRRAPKKHNMQALKAFVASGKPLIAIRTASHAFHLRGKPAPEGRELWEEFDPVVLGGNYNGHYKDEPATISVDAAAKAHPILNGVDKLQPTDRLYKAAPLAKGTTSLLLATIEGQKPEPVAWTNRFGEKKARIFYTSLGLKEEFQTVGFKTLLRNAIDWVLEKD